MKTVKPCVNLIFLAAGYAKRFGSNKLLTEFQGKPLFEHGLNELIRLQKCYDGRMSLLVVTAYPKIINYCKKYGISSVFHCGEQNDGIASSIKAGICALKKTEQTAYDMFIQADLPYLNAGLLSEFLRNFFRQERSIGTMALENVWKSPNIFAAGYREELMRLTGEEGGKVVMKRHREEVFAYPVSEKLFFADIDTEEDKIFLYESVIRKNKEVSTMRMYDLIEKKKLGEELTTEEIRFMIAGFTDGSIPDYQMSAMTMAICFQGMNKRETVDLTLAMRDSGDVLDLSKIPGIKVDKHSTGGVGDKTSLALTPIVAALGVPVAKMSGRGLGHTGGTIDKLECFPGFTTEITEETFIKNVTEIGIAIAGQTANLAPADKKLYALRDVTATVDQMSLIASSIMSKKLASGSDAIVLDVKTGNGAFMKKYEDSVALAKAMVAIGTMSGKKTAAVITDMDQPLGFAIGNSVEVIEAIETLNGRGPEDFKQVVFALGSLMLQFAGRAKDEAEAFDLMQSVIDDGSALKKMAEFVQAQGGNPDLVFDTGLFPKASFVQKVAADKDGYVHRILAENIGIACMTLGGGRETKDSVIDLSVGIILEKKNGDEVKCGDTLAVIYGNDRTKMQTAEEKVLQAYEISEEKKVKEPVVRTYIFE